MNATQKTRYEVGLATAACDAVVAARKPRSKPARHIRLEARSHDRTFDARPGRIVFAVGGVEQTYLYWRSSPSSFRLLKWDGHNVTEKYDVTLDGTGSCTCKGFAGWRRCKHRDGLAALVKAGRL